MAIKEDSLALMASLQRLYLDERDMEKVLSMLDHCIAWTGSGELEQCNGINQARNLLRREKEEYTEGFAIERFYHEAIELSDKLCMVYGTVNARARSKRVDDLNARFSALIMLHSEGLRVHHIHYSHPDFNQRQGEFFVRRETRVENNQLRLKMAQTERALTELTENIPGGIYQCRTDAGITLLSMNSGFLQMFGYTRDEIRILFGNRLINMIHPADREMVSHQMRDVLEQGGSAGLEYRVLCRNDETIWVLDKVRIVPQEHEENLAYCMLIDITERKRQQEELRLLLERHQVIMNQTTDIIFEWEMQKDHMEYSANWEKLFGYPPLRLGYAAQLPVLGHAHSDDIPVLQEYLQRLRNGEPYAELEIRIADNMGHFRWCRVRATVQFNEEHQPIKAVGVIVNIDEEKKRTLRLIDRAQKDGLTGLLNRAAMEGAIEQQLLADQGLLQALLIIDLDNFKQVNDCFGHLCGDEVLTDVGAMLQKLFRATDLVGRIGGDEFLAFMTDLPNRKAAIDRAEAICNLMHRIDEHLQMTTPLSCSIGIAFAPDDAEDYNTLYHCADCALYSVKNRLKNDCAVYEGDMNCELRVRNEDSAVSHADLDLTGVSDARLGYYCFHTLSQTDDFEKSMEQILEIVGRMFQASRIYIFETAEAGASCCCTYEWRGDGVASCKHALQEQRTLSDFEPYFAKDNRFVCEDSALLPSDLQSVMQLQEATYTLQFAMREKGAFLGFIGFDRRNYERQWTREQLESLSMISDVLATFLRKQYYQKRVERLEALYKT